MNSDFNCLSVMELLELREGAKDPAAEHHLATCPRCQALLRSLPADLPRPFPELRPVAASPARSEVARSVPVAGRVRTGALWRAAATPDADFAWVVAVIGRSPDAEDRLLVAPIAGRAEMATDKDLVLDASVLGYRAFLDMTNLGTLRRDQLIEPVGELQRPLGAGPAPQDARRGLPAVDEADPRLLEQAARAEALRALWRPTDMLVQDEEDRRDDADKRQVAREPVSS
jgi:hypothetical protein